MTTFHRLSFLAIALLLANSVHAADTAPFARYRVHYLGSDRFRVEATFAQPTSRLDLNASSPPGRPDGQAASVKGLQAFDGEGRPVPIEFVGDGTWEMKQAPARRIRYELVADHDAVAWRAGKEEVASKFDRTYYFVGDAFFLVDYRWPVAPIAVEFELPDDWRVTSPWAGTDRHFVAQGADALGSNAFAMGADPARSAKVGDLQLTWLSDSRVADAAEAMVPLFERLPAAYTQFWGGSPGEHLNIYLLSDTMTDGGAFKNSFAMRLDTPLRKTEQPIWMHTLAHELMHIWMNQSNDGIGRAAGGSHYWFTEGFTDYLTIKLMRQAGLTDRDMAAQRIANLIRRYELARRLSPGIGMMAGGEKKHDNWELVYGGGAMVALLLDAELSQQSPNAFRDLLRGLQHEGGKAMDGAALLARLDEGSDGHASEIFKKLDAGMALSAIRERLGAAGIGVEGYASDEVYVEFAACRGDTCADNFWLSGQSAQ